MAEQLKTETHITSARNTSQNANGSEKTILLSDMPTQNQTAPPQPLTSALSSSQLEALSQRYDILSEAGHGNMGNVYKARDRETGETVALKLIKPEIASDQAMMERFKNELLFARKITHKNVCRVYDFNRIGGIACTSMEFVEGESLRSVLNRFGGLPVRKGLDLALQICSGLKEAHAQGIIHRDLKPENVMIDAQGNLKIMDFGIARSMEAGTRLTGAMIGTPAYMAPEQVSGKSVDYRTDIYALGLILYEMFTGAQAFQADTAVAIALKQMREEPPAPHEVDPTIPVFIERAILKCLEKEPAKRFSSISELENALRAGRVTGTFPTGAIASATPAPLAVAGSVGAIEPQARPITVVPVLPAQKSKHGSPFAWALIGAVVVLATLAGAHELAVMKSAKRIPAPAQASAPVPPASAFQIPAQPANSQPVPTPKKVSTPPKPLVPEVFPHIEYGRKQQRPSKGGNVAAYIWVGRFQNEGRAQSVAQSLEDHNLPAIVQPRQTPFGQKFFVILTGPFAQDKAQEVVSGLQRAGFDKARIVRPGQGQGRPAQQFQQQ